MWPFSPHLLILQQPELSRPDLRRQTGCACCSWPCSLLTCPLVLDESPSGVCSKSPGLAHTAPSARPCPSGLFFYFYFPPLVFSLFMSNVLSYNLHTITHIFSVTFDEFWRMSIPCETHTLIKTQNVFIIPETFLAALRSIFPAAHSRQPLIHFLSVFPFPKQNGAFARDFLHSA